MWWPPRWSQRSHLLVFMLLYNPPPLSACWTWWFISNKQITAKWCNVTSWLAYEKTVASVLLCFHSLLIAGTDETCCHVISCQMERPAWWGTERGLWPVSWEKVNPVNNHVSELRSGSFLSWAFRWDHSPRSRRLDGSLMRELEVEAPTKPCQKL